MSLDNKVNKAWDQLTNIANRLSSNGRRAFYVGVISSLALTTGARLAKAETRYVDDDAKSLNNGTSWVNAYNHLQDALAAALNGDEIRVAQGIYKPDQGGGNTLGDREATYQLKNGVTINGGFAGAGEVNPDARDIEAYETILSGDLNGDDAQVDNPEDLLDEPSRAENSYHVVTGSGTDATTVLDGVTITAGNDNRYDHLSRLPRPLGYGGGICNDSGTPTVTNCTFSANSASGRGGGMYNGGSSPTIANCIFSGNSASIQGGGMYNWYSQPALTDCIFNGNLADMGGGICNCGGSPAFRNCIFSGNSAINGGGLYNIENSNPILNNCTFWGNDNWAVSNGANSNTKLINCIVWRNTAGQIRGTARVLYSDVEEGFAGEGNINSNPYFANPDIGDYHLQSQAGRWDSNRQQWIQDNVTSPCIDAGNMSSPIGFEAFPNGGRVNMGAHGGTVEASKSWFGRPVYEMLFPGDLNGDCAVNPLDMAILALHWLEGTSRVSKPTSALAYPGPDGRLVYTTYSNVGDTRSLNILPDWSNCGYMGGGVKIPDVPVKMIVEPIDGDDGAHIQAAIDYVSGLPLDSNGFRGAVLLTEGTYDVEGTIFITASGVVLRGEGQTPHSGTRIVYTGRRLKTDPRQGVLISVEGKAGGTKLSDTPTRITDSFVPVGATSFRIQSAAGFVVGDQIVVYRQTNQRWIDDLDMGQYGWNPMYYEDGWERVINSIDGNRIAIDAPIVQAIEDQYGGGSIFKHSSGGRISNVGVECLWLESRYEYDTDEDHGWNAIDLRNVENGWVRQVTSRYFGYACVNTKGGTKNVTIEDCACLDPKSQTIGMRKYSFPIDDCCFVLIQRCFTRGGRHDYITHSRVPGPNAFVDCLAIECHSDSGNHHRYAEGTLFDNVKARYLAVENRQSSGTGHGWSGAQTLFWNCEATTICHAPLGAMNWSIGVIGEMQLGSAAPDEPLGYWEAHGTHVTPRSLYYKQLEDRLGYEAVASVTIPAQRSGPIWNQLSTWAGVGRIEDVSHIKRQLLDGPSANTASPTGEALLSEPVCETIVAGDLNGDCKVDLNDFALLAGDWRKQSIWYKQ